MKKQIFIVIPVHNRKKHTQCCLHLLETQSYADFRVIVVDDGSTDGTSEMIREKFPDVQVVRGDGTWYWTASVYEGIEVALKKCKNVDFIMVLNDDLYFDSDFLKKISHLAESYPDALIHPCTSYESEPDVIRFGGATVNWWTGKTHYINRGKRISSFEKGYIQASSILWGQGLLIPVHILRDIGNYDRRIVHRGDPELPRRASKKGYRLLVTYDTIVQIPEDENKSINKKNKLTLRDANDYFFNVLSHGNLKMLYVSAMLMADNKIQGYSRFIFSILRHGFVFFRHLNHI